MNEDQSGSDPSGAGKCPSLINAATTHIPENISVGEEDLFGKTFGCILDPLRKIQDSKSSGRGRLENFKVEIMPLLLDLAEKEGPASPALGKISDHCAIFLRTIYAQAGSGEKDLKTAEEAICLAEKLVKNEEMKAWIRGETEVLKNLVRESTCYFCSERLAEVGCNCEVPMFGEVRVEHGKLIYRNVRISIPRCSGCRVLNGSNVDWGCLPHVIFAPIFLGLGILAGNWFIGFLIGCVFGWVVSLAVQGGLGLPGVPGFKNVRNHPKIRELRARGWALGERLSK